MHQLKYISLEDYIEAERKYLGFINKYPYIYHPQRESLGDEFSEIQYFLHQTAEKMIVLNNICYRCLEATVKDIDNFEDKVDNWVNIADRDEYSVRQATVARIGDEYSFVKHNLSDALLSLLVSFITDRLDELYKVTTDKEFKKEKPKKYHFSEIKMRIYMLLKDNDNKFPKNEEANSIEKFMEEEYKKINKVLPKLKEITDKVNRLKHANKDSSLKFADKSQSNRLAALEGTNRVSEDYESINLKDAFSDVKELFSAIENELLPKMKEPKRNW